MRCASYCTTSSYNSQDLVEFLTSEGLQPRFFDEVIYVSKAVESRVIEIFYFPFGSLVIWGAEENEEKLILNQIKSSSKDACDLIYYIYDQKSEKTFINEEKNEIILNDKSVFIKISISYALAQSVKLQILERSVSSLLKNTNHIKEELTLKGRVSLSKKKISQQIGTLFNERYSINLHSDILDTPEFFRRRPRYEPLYLMTADFQDIQVRRNILNHRLDIIHELYSILSNELNYIHSKRLEMIIIALIAIEVILGIVAIIK